MGNRPVFPWMTAYIIMACTAMLALQSVLPQPAESRHLPTLLPLLPDYVSMAFSADYWQIPLAGVSFLSYAFQHSGYAHFGVNIFLFLILGPLLELPIGHRPMLVFFLACATGAGLLHYFFTAAPGLPVVGLSGVVVGLLAVLSLAVPRVKIMAIPFTNLKLRLYQVGLLILATQLQGFFAGPGVGGGDRTAYQLHLGGALAGVALWAFWLRQRIAEFRKTPEKHTSQMGLRGVVSLPPSYFE